MPATLTELAGEYGVVLPEGAEARFAVYTGLLLEWNARLNLTAITDPQDIVVKHYLDSLLLLEAAELPQGASLIDVGTGAGFPGIPLKLARPDLQLTLLDSLQKRLHFLERVCEALELDCRLHHDRAEDAARLPVLRESYNIATARAVAPLPVLCEYCLPFVGVGGLFAALKGPGAGEELTQAKEAIQLLGGEVQSCKRYALPDGGERNIVLVRKISQTPAQYPRNPKKIAKSPL